MDCRYWLLGMGVLALGCSFDTLGTQDSGNNLAEDSTGMAEDDDGELSTTSGNTDSNSGNTDSNSGTDPSGTSSPTDPSNPTDPSETDPSETDPTNASDPSDSMGTDSMDTDSMGTDSETDTNVDGTAVLQLSNEQFGNVDLGSAEEITLTLSNEGDATATNIMIGLTGAGLYDADCGMNLDAGDSCTINVEVNGSTLGPLTVGTLDIDYDDGQAAQLISREFDAQVVGVTSNLVPDSSFEGCSGGNLPQGWTGNMVCSNSFNSNGVAPATGQQLLRPSHNDGNIYTAQWTFDVSDYANAIETGNAEFRFRMDARSLGQFGGGGFDNNFVVRFYIDNFGSPVFNTNAAGTSSWSLYDHDEDAPTNANEVRIELVCQKSNGESECNAYFDDASFRVSYNP